MARTSTRRWKGCPMCKDHKHAAHGDSTRMPPNAVRRMGTRSATRITRRTLPDPE